MSDEKYALNGSKKALDEFWENTLKKSEDKNTENTAELQARITEYETPSVFWSGRVSVNDEVRRALEAIGEKSETVLDYDALVDAPKTAIDEILKEITKNKNSKRK